MAMEAWHQVPGIDMLFNNRERHPEQFGNIRSVKELGSVANQLGRKRTLSETYGGSGWELSFADMKVNGDWEYVLGVNFMNQHLSYQTITGDRKHDYPQSFSAHEPWWNEYKSLAGYFARLSVALTSGEQISHILVLEPTSTAWMYTGGNNQHDEFRRIDSDFRDLLERLEYGQVEYDLGSEDIIRRHGSVNNGCLIVGQRSYDIVIIPGSMENLGADIAEKLETMLQQGGDLIVTAQLPAYIDGEPTDRCTGWSKNFGNNLLLLKGNIGSEINELLTNRKFVLIESSGGKFLHQRRELSDGQLLFMVNTDSNTESVSSWNMPGIDVVKPDPFTGKYLSYPCVQSDNSVSFSVKLPPSGSLLLFVANKEIREKGMPELSFNGEKTELPLTDFHVGRVKENVMPIDYCVLRCESVHDDTCYYYNAEQKVFREYGYAGNPWSSSIQFKSEFMDANTFGRGTGFSAVYLFNTDSLPVGTPLKMALEHPEYYSVTFNDHELKPVKGEYWLEEDIGIFDLTGLVVNGENRFRIRVEPMDIRCEIAPVILTGEFSLKPAASGWTVTAPEQLSTGSWRSQGYPFYSGFVDYTATLDYSATSGDVRLIPGKWEGTLARVLVNGKEAGQIYMPDDMVRIDPLLVKGPNEVTFRVYGSLKNILGPHHGSPHPGDVNPSDFRRAPEKMPPGQEYDLRDYGLFEPFRIEVKE